MLASKVSGKLPKSNLGHVAGEKGLNVAAYSEDNTYTFTVYAIIRNKEYAGPQKIPFTFKYYAYEVAEVSKTDGSYSAIFDTETKIDPYNAPFPSFPRTVYVKFKKQVRRKPPATTLFPPPTQPTTSFGTNRATTPSTTANPAKSWPSCRDRALTSKTLSNSKS